jgi:aminocarboxymuconate-semialdehyde decarboxylase
MIDIFTHVVPPRYKAALGQIEPDMEGRIARMATLYDMDRRFKIMDGYDGLKQILTLSLTAALVLENPAVAVDFARRANDEITELVRIYPDRFAAGVASLPMTDIEAALGEMDRAVVQLGLKGIQIFTPVMDKPLDSEEFLPLFARIYEHDLPIWIHPVRKITYPDYRSLSESQYYIYHIFGWPYETSAAMVHLVFGGIFDRFPGIKIITHHCGAMVPFFEQRLAEAYIGSQVIHGLEYKNGLSRPPLDYFKMFYADTVLNGSVMGLRCGYSFFGPEHLLFGTDMPFDIELGNRAIRETIRSVEELHISDGEKKMIYEDNARRLLHL